MFLNFWLIGKVHKFVFHNSIDCNRGRGFSIFIVVFYSTGIKDDLDKIPYQNYEKTLLELRNNNGQALELINIDINPLLAVQTIDVSIKNNVIGCVLFCVSSNSLEPARTRLNVGEALKNEEIHVDCVHNGIVYRLI